MSEVDSETPKHALEKAKATLGHGALEQEVINSIEKLKKRQQAPLVMVLENKRSLALLRK